MFRAFYLNSWAVQATKIYIGTILLLPFSKLQIMKKIKPKISAS